jgi:hypothetical protein
VPKALVCPSCRAQHLVDELGPDPTFPCSKCGQILKVPESMRTAVAAAARATSGNGQGTAVLGESAAVASVDSTPKQRRRGRKRGRKRGRERGGAADVGSAPRPDVERTPWPLRILAWLVAVPLGGAVVVYPARQLGFLSGDDLADVIIGTGAGRYYRLAIVVVLWALATAIVVQVLLVGGRALAHRRRREPAPAPPAPAPAAAISTPASASRSANSARQSRRSPAPAAAPAGAGAATARTARSAQRLRATAGRRTGS